MIALFVAVGRVRWNVDERFLRRCRKANGEGLCHSFIHHAGGRCDTIADRWVVVLSGSDRGFTKDGAAR